jgi:hypothetical protein
MLVSMLIVRWFGPPATCGGVCFVYVCDADECISSAVVRSMSCRVFSVCAASLRDREGHGSAPPHSWSLVLFVVGVALL